MHAYLKKKNNLIKKSHASVLFFHRVDICHKKIKLRREIKHLQ